MPMATLVADHARATRLASVDPAWAPWMPNLPNAPDIPANQNAGCFNKGPFGAVHGQAPFATAPRWSAFADGRYFLFMMSDNGWAPIADEDFGPSVIRAFGFDGHACQPIQ
eukprot:4829594-Pyramimonas_sp.AAC.1